jgi:hypothetical protein
MPPIVKLDAEVGINNRQRRPSCPAQVLDADVAGLVSVRDIKERLKLLAKDPASAVSADVDRDVNMSNKKPTPTVRRFSSAAGTAPDSRPLVSSVGDEDLSSGYGEKLEEDLTVVSAEIPLPSSTSFVRRPPVSVRRLADKFNEVNNRDIFEDEAKPRADSTKQLKSDLEVETVLHCEPKI